jgi:hypothetical protein
MAIKSGRRCIFDREDLFEIRCALHGSITVSSKFESFTALNRFVGKPIAIDDNHIAAYNTVVIVRNRLGVSAHLPFLYSFSSNKNSPRLVTRKRGRYKEIDELSKRAINQNAVPKERSTASRVISLRGAPLKLENKMNERRRSLSRIKRLRGRLYLDRHGRKSRSCQIIDAFYEGARIIVDSPARIPDQVDLYIPKKKRIAHASVRWRHGRKLGLALTEIEHQAGDHPARH